MKLNKVMASDKIYELLDNGPQKTLCVTTYVLPSTYVIQRRAAWKLCLRGRFIFLRIVHTYLLHGSIPTIKSLSGHQNLMQKLGNIEPISYVRTN